MMRVYEMPRELFHVAAPLFADVWIDKALIDSVFEGSEPARVFVDDVGQPAAAFMCCGRGDYIIIGDESLGPIRQFIKDMPSEAEVFDRESYAFFMPQAAWEQALAEDFEGEISIFATRSFRYSFASIAPLEHWQRNLRNDATVVPIDSELLDKLEKGIVRTGKDFRHRGQDGAEISREELAGIERKAFGHCVVVGGEIASVASAFGLSSKYASLSIDTSRPFRRQGLATLACVALIQRCLDKGLIPLWNCLASNDASTATALRLGMEEGPLQRESQWRPEWRHIETTSGLWTKVDDSRSDVMVWQQLENSA